MFAPREYQLRMASLERAEAVRGGAVPRSFAAIALARRLKGRKPERTDAVDPVAASRCDGKALFFAS